MAETEHTTETELAAFMAGETDLDAESQLTLAGHLATDCPVCWEVVEALPPTDPRGATTPFQRALSRIGEPRSWLLLRSDHLKAVRRTRSMPLGFAHLWAQEAYEKAQGLGEDECTEPLALPWSLVEAMLFEEPDSEAANDLAARIQSSLVLLHLVLEKDARRAAQAATAAEQYRRLGSGSNEIEAAVMEGRTLLTYVMTSEPTTDEIRKSLRLLGPDEPIRRFEIVTEQLKRQALYTLGYLPKREALSQLRSESLSAIRELEGLSRVTDPIYRMNGLVHKLAFASNMVFTINTWYTSNVGHRVLPVDRITAEVEAALDELKTLCNLDTMGRVYEWLGQIHIPSSLPRALDWLRLALDCFAEMECSKSFANTVHCLIINHGRRDPEKEFYEDAAEQARQVFRGEDLEGVLESIRDTRVRKKKRPRQ